MLSQQRPPVATGCAFRLEIGAADTDADRSEETGEDGWGPTVSLAAPSPSRLNTRQTCLAAVRAYAAEMADAGTYPGLNGYQRAARERNWPNATAVVDRLGSWRDALVAAGVEAPRRRAEAFVTGQDCIAAVAAYAEEAARRGEHPGLVGYERLAASRRWPSRTTVTARLGPWTAALHAAGVNPPSMRRPDQGDCLIAVGCYVAEMTRAGRYPGLRGFEAVASSRGWPSARVVTGQLGAWEAALRRAGFADSRRSRPGYITREACIAAVRAYVAEATMAGRHPGVVGYDAVSTERGWPRRQSTVMARLGSWSAALSAAGYSDPIHQRGHRVSRGKCLAAVGSYLAEAAESGTVPTLAGYGKMARSRGWPAVATMLARLGSWQQALQSAAPPATERFDRRRQTPAPGDAPGPRRLVPVGAV